MKEDMVDLQRRIRDLEQVLEDLFVIPPLHITKPFWWDCNQAWGMVVCSADWYRILYYSMKAFPGESAEYVQQRMLEANGFLRDGENPPSFGFRREHIGAPLTLKDYLGV